MEPKILITKPSADYELIDSGNEEKLERYGKYVLRRPDPQALWNKTLSENDWKGADATFGADRKTWKKKNESMQNEWQISFDDLKFNIKPTAFKHTGVFPEQSSNWSWIISKIKEQRASRLNDSRDVIPLNQKINANTKEAKLPKGEMEVRLQISNTNRQSIKVLNLFGYTGGATLAALSAGAEVTHVDGSKSAITWAKENAELSGLINKPVRWIIDDARKFVMREIKRGGKYDAIIMDPPSFGRGGKGEIWKIETDFIKLLDECQKILSDNPLFFIINGYASGYSSIAYYNVLKSITEKYGGQFEFGELTILESKGKRLLPCGIFVRWYK